MNPDCPNPTRFIIFWENLKVLLNSVIKFTKKTFIMVQFYYKKSKIKWICYNKNIKP